MQHVLIADDHEVTRRGLREILADAFAEIVVGEAADADGLLAQLHARPWELILLDVMMPGPGVLATLAQIRAQLASVPVLILTAATELEYVLQTMKAGANGLIHKHRASDELLDAIARVAGGGTYLHPDTAAAIAAGLHDGQPPPCHARLSPRELDIFRRIALGRAIKEIAGDLGLSEKTVATYLARIREKTGLGSHVEIARYALRAGLVE